MSAGEHAHVGLVLSSGGARGIFAHTGFLLALKQLGISYHALAGCSAGAVVGGIVASGTSLSDWAEAIAAMKATAFWQPRPWWHVAWQILVRRGRGYTGISGTEAAVRACRGHLTAQTFEECRYPFWVLAHSLSQNRKVLFSQGALAERMIASAAVPILYEPVAIDGEWYCDGAIVEFDPIDAICCGHDLDLVLVHHVAARREGKERLNAAMRARWSLLRLVDWIIYRQHMWYLTDDRLSFHTCPGGCGTPIVVLEPSLPDLPWPVVEGGMGVLAKALEQAVAALAPIKDRLMADPHGFVLDADSPGLGDARPRG